MTTRSVARILSTITHKLKHMVSLATNDAHSPDAIERALSNPATEQILQRRISQGHVKLRRQNTNEPVFEEHLARLGQKGYAAAQEEESMLEQSFASQGEPEDAILDIQSEAMDEIVGQVNEFVRKESLKKGAK